MGYLAGYYIIYFIEWIEKIINRDILRKKTFNTNTLFNSTQFFLKHYIFKLLSFIENTLFLFILIFYCNTSLAVKCKDCKNQSNELTKQIKKQQVVDIKTCKLVSDKQALMKGELSDY